MNTRRDIIILLLSIINSEAQNSTNSLIAQTILENLESLADVSIQSLAKMCNVSTATISRFCRALNIDSFYELKYLINDYLNEPSLKFDIKGLDLMDFNLNTYIDLITENIESMKETVDMDSIDAIAKEIIESDDVIFTGILQSGTAALNLQFSLTRLGITSKVIVDPFAQKNFWISDKKKTFILAFSKSGTLLRQLFHKNTFSKTNRPKIGMITQNESYVKENYVDYVVNLKLTRDYSAEGAPLALISNLIVLRCYYYVNLNK